MMRSAFIVVLMFCCNLAVAGDYFSLPEGWEGSGPAMSAVPENRLLLASATDMSMSASEAAPAYRDRAFTANKLHKYLGIGSIAAAGLTLMMPKEEDGPHEAFGRTAATLGVGAVLTGLFFHSEEIELGNGFSDPDNLHALLGTLGTLGYLAAVSTAPEAHGGVGGLGAVSMAVGIKLVW